MFHHAPFLHEIVSATVAGHSCPAGCQKIGEIEAFLEAFLDSWSSRGS